MAPRTLPQLTRDDATTAILAAAREILATEGQAALTVRRIAADAGGSTMNVYSRFGGKDGVVDALVIDGFDQLAEAMDRVSTTDDPLVDLEGVALAYREFALTHHTHYELMFDQVVPGYVKSPLAVVAAQAALGMLADRVQRAMDAGVLRSDDPLLIATVFWSACHGPVSLEIKVVGPPTTRWAEVHRRLFAALLAGMSTTDDAR